MPPKKQRGRDPRPGPAEFLRRLGLRRSSMAEVFTDSFWDEVRRAGGDPRDIARCGGYSPQAGDALFVTERVAKRSLSAEYDSTLFTLEYLRRLGERLPPPRQVADIGGGTGVVSLYLAASHPGCEATVYDHSPAQLALGRRWAAGLAPGRVRYEEATYAQLAGKVGPGDSDLVLFLRGMDMRLPSPDSGDTSLAVPACPARRPDPGVLAPLTAVANLLAPTGVGVIGCEWSGWGLVTLFEAIRAAGLGVDWSQVRCRVAELAGVPGLIDSNVVVRPGVPPLARSSHDEATAFLNSAKFPDGPWATRPRELAAVAGRFSGGEELLRATTRAPYRRAETVRLVAAGGYLLLEGRAGADAVWGLEDTLAGVGDLLAVVRDIRGKCGLCGLEVAPQLERFIRGCLLPGVGLREPA